MKKKEVKDKPMDLYSDALLNKTIVLDMNNVNERIKETLEKMLLFQYDGKCIYEGFIKKGSINLLTYSSGMIEKGNKISFRVTFVCKICFPVEGSILSCKVELIVKAGICAISSDEVPSPIYVYIANDIFYNQPDYQNVKINDIIKVRVLGQKSELNDKHVSVIGEII
jgi:DNA-directed RNA polymerase subunit E'/Rpb7